MMSGDGLIVRVRPWMGRLSSAQLDAIAAISDQYGNGQIDVTNRANVQVRGIHTKDHGAVLDALAQANLLDANSVLESRRNVLISPIWQEGDLTCRLADELVRRLEELPDLPAKFGFSIDVGPVRHLSAASADIRLERAADGRLIVRADGLDAGRLVAEDEAIDRVMDLARWFSARRDKQFRRMALVLQSQQPEGTWQELTPTHEQSEPQPELTEHGQIVGLPFGRLATKLISEITLKCLGVRLTHNRMLLLEGISGFGHDDAITQKDDPLLRVDACPGMPHCISASIQTRTVARQIATKVSGTLHVSGCEKGCARKSAANTTIVGRDGLIDLIENGTVQSTPKIKGLSPQQLLNEI